MPFIRKYGYWTLLRTGDVQDPATTERLVSTMSSLPNLYLFGVPGKIGGAATKIEHLIRLLHGNFRITVVPPATVFGKDKEVRPVTEPFGVPLALLKDLPKKLDSVG